jgi:Outer membrane protein Omp28
LLEDYTGHTCPNCPRAAETAENLIATYGSSIIVIASHVSNTFAKPKTDTTFKEDFRNAASTAWDEDPSIGMGMSNAGLPKGTVNRIQPYPRNHTAWPSLVGPELNKPQSAKIDLTTYYDKLSKYLTVEVKSTFLTSWPNSANLQVILVQDSIVSDQYDNKPPAGATMDPEDPIRRLNYRFDHIVVGSVNGNWGELAKLAPINVNDTASKKYECFLVEKCFFKKDPYPSVCLDDTHISVVVFLYDAKTLEILQVEKVKIR